MDAMSLLCAVAAAATAVEKEEEEKLRNAAAAFAKAKHARQSALAAVAREQSKKNNKKRRRSVPTKTARRQKKQKAFDEAADLKLSRECLDEQLRGTVKFVRCNKSCCTNPCREVREKHAAILRRHGADAATTYLDTAKRAHRGPCRPLRAGDAVEMAFLAPGDSWRVYTGVVQNMLYNNTHARILFEDGDDRKVRLFDYWWVIAEREQS